MELAALYRDHVKALQKNYAKAIEEVKAEGLGLDGVLLHSGSENYYFADDNHVPFRPVPNFAHWVPLDGPNHFLLFRPGAQLRLVRNVPRDFWYETPTDLADYWQ